jgi:hypothetical protein
MKKLNKKPKLCNYLGLNKSQNMSKIIYIKKCLKMKLENENKDYKGLE